MTKEEILHIIKCIKDQNYSDIIYSEKNLIDIYKKQYDCVFIPERIMNQIIKSKNISSKECTVLRSLNIENLNILDDHVTYWYRYWAGENWKYTPHKITIKSYSKGSQHNFQNGEVIEAHSDFGLNYYKKAFPQEVFLITKKLFIKYTCTQIFTIYPIVGGYLLPNTIFEKNFRTKLNEYKSYIKELDLNS